MARTPSPAQPDGTDAEAPANRKGAPTPTRREREAARRRPLVPKDRKLARQQQRAQLQANRERARIGLANGEEKYLPIRDKGPQKRYVRDFVDARWSVGEILMPMLFLVILTYFVPSTLVAQYALLAVWALLLFVVIDCIVLGAQLKRRLGEKFGASKVERGVRWYAAMRAIQLRPLRMPKPQVKRGQYPN